ncbi:MAG: hypothetical protein ACREV6_02890 [Clostridium sp.]|uniref:hypothetical protein n=1 Tax=Clostridium sp. TaxID=1506 RepID=UPI003D6CDF17
MKVFIKGSDNSDNQTKFDGNIKFNSDYSNGGFKVNSFKAERNGDNVEFTLNYESTSYLRISIILCN